MDLGRRGPGRGGRENLTEVIKNGTESGMPAFRLPENQIATLVAYIRDLRAPAAERPAQGNAENGARFFAGKGDCMRCHMVNGSGGTLGPDLSNIGRERRVQQIEQALRKPGSSGMPGYQAVSVRLLDGSTVRGVARNESTFDLQVQTFDGKLRSFAKSQIAGLTRESKSLMPAVTAPDEEMRDLLAYLSRLTRDNKGRGGNCPGPFSATVAYPSNKSFIPSRATGPLITETSAATGTLRCLRSTHRTWRHSPRNGCFPLRAGNAWR